MTGTFQMSRHDSIANIYGNKNEVVLLVSYCVDWYNLRVELESIYVTSL